MNLKRKITLILALVLTVAALFSVMIVGASAATVSKTVKIDGKDYTVSVSDTATVALFAKTAGASASAAWDFVSGYDKVVDNGFQNAADLLAGTHKTHGTKYKGGSVYLCMLGNYTVSRGSGWNNAFYLEGNFTFDLGGYTMISKAPRLFGFLAINTTKGYVGESNVTVKNGTIATNKVLMEIWPEGGSAHYAGTKTVNFTLDNVTVTGTEADNSTTYYMFSSSTRTSNGVVSSFTSTMRADVNVVMNNCKLNNTASAFVLVNDTNPAGAVALKATLNDPTINCKSFAASNGKSTDTANKMSAEDSVSIHLSDYNATATENYTESSTLYFTSDKKFIVLGKKAGASSFNLFGTFGTYNGMISNIYSNLKAGGAYAGGEMVTYMISDRTWNGTGTNVTDENGTGGWNNAANLNGKYTFDLGGNIFTAGAPRIFGFLSTADTFDSSIVVKNGTLRTSKIVAEVWSEGKSFAATRNFSIAFEDLTVIRNGSPTSFVLTGTKGSKGFTGDMKANFNVTIKNCHMDYSTASSITLVNDTITGGGSINCTLAVTDGNISAKTSLYPIAGASLSASDTYAFKKVSSTNGTTFIFDYATDLSEITFNTDEGIKHLASNGMGDRVTYVLSNLLIEGYGYIPESEKDKTFSIFDTDRNLHLGSYGSYANGAIERVRSLGNPFSTACSGLYANKSVTVLLRKDYTHTDDWYGNYAHITNITLDLGGHTIIQKANGLFNFIPKKTTLGSQTTINETKTVVKNGTILTRDMPIIKINTTRGTGNFDYSGDKVYSIEFYGVTFDKYWATNDKVEKYVSIFKSEADGDLGVDFKASFNDCNFTSCNTVMFDAALSNTLKANVEINGGIINTSDMSTLNILSASDENDTLTFGKGEDGKYTSLVMPASAAVPTGSYNNGSLVFVKDSTGAETATYILRDKSVASITYSPKVSITLDRSLYLNVYVPTESLVNFTFEGTAYNDLSDAEHLLKTVGGKNYYVISTPLSSFEALNSLSLTVTVNAGEKNAVGKFSFSIPAYAKSVFNSGTLVEKQVVRDVLSYIRASYAYFKPDDTASIAIVDKLIGKNYDVTAPVTPEGSNSTNTPGLSGAALDVNAVPGIRFYIASDATSADYSFYYLENGKEVAIASEEGTDSKGRYLEIDVYAYAMCETVYYRGADGVNGSYHIASYHEWAKTQNNPALVTIVERLWRYCQSARDYRNAVTVTFNYVDESGNSLAESKVVRKVPGAEVSFMSPAVSGYYTRDLYAYSSATENETVNVVYKPIPTNANEELVKEYLSDIAAWGDSITQGSSANSGNTNAAKDHGIDLEALGSTANGATYSQVLTKLISSRLYSGFTVYNNGVGSEPTSTIACRANTKSYYFYIDTAATLETSPIVLDLHQNKDLTLDGLREGVLRREDNFGYIKNVYMTGKDESGNEVTVSGILTCTAPDGYQKLNCAYDLLTYTFTRTDGKTNKVTFDKDTRVVTQASIIFDGLTCIIFMGENGGYNKDNATIISQQEEILEACGNPEFFLIISSTSKTTAARQSLNDALTARWGRNYINMGNVLNSSRASYEYAGYSEEAIVSVLDNIIEGSVTELLLTDGCHPNAVGVTVMANAMFERLFELGAFKDLLDYYDSLNA